ncbi:MAG: hypothetical protein HY652_04860 [Acidobacteria bacterium]|nr:hypothetical protein [Acidobacteriota bacterium]
MPPVILPESVATSPSSLVRSMLRNAHGYWTAAEGYQRFLYLVGVLLLASAVFHAGVLVVTGGSLTGDVSWRKPILFGEAFGLTALSVGWIMAFLPKRRVLGWVLALMLGVANTGEVFWVAMQQWRGVPSHFNNSTPFDAAAFALAGFLILLTGIVIVIVALLSFISLEANRSLAWAIRISMLLLIAAQVIGILMIRRGGNTFGPAGAMKVPHAAAIHAPQVLLVLAWLLLFANWRESRRTRVLILGAVGYTVAVALSASQSLRGLAPFDLDVVSALVLGAAVAGIMGAYGAALFALRPRLT